MRHRKEELKSRLIDSLGSDQCHCEPETVEEQTDYNVRSQQELAAKVGQNSSATGAQQTIITSTRRQSTLTSLRALWTLVVVVVLAACGRLASGAMNLPDGIENVLGFVPKSSFQCERDGYFGDVENDCRIFHLCQKQIHSNGRTEWRHWTYACGNQTMFNQLTLTCAFIDEAIPCRHAPQFQYLNEVIHRPKEPFLTDADVTSGFSYYSNRIMSDGARARAFEDSQLMAQLGGGGGSIGSQTHHSQQQAHHQQHHHQHHELKPKIVAATLPASQSAAVAAPERRHTQQSQPQPQPQPQQQPQVRLAASTNSNQNWLVASNQFGDSSASTQSFGQPAAAAQFTGLQQPSNRFFEPFFANQQQHQQQQSQPQPQQQSTSNRLIENRLFQIHHNNAANNFISHRPPSFQTFVQQPPQSAQPLQPQQQVQQFAPPQNTQQSQQLQPQQSIQRPQRQHQQQQVFRATSARAPTTTVAPITLSQAADTVASNGAPQSFAFTLTTDHRLGSSSVHHSQQHQQVAPVARANFFAPTGPTQSTQESGTVTSFSTFSTSAQTTPSPTTEALATTSLVPTDSAPTTLAASTAPLDDARSNGFPARTDVTWMTPEPPTATTTTTTTTTTPAPTTTTAAAATTTTTTTSAPTTSAAPQTTTTTTATTSTPPPTTTTLSGGRSQRRRQPSSSSSSSSTPSTTSSTSPITATRWQSTRLSAPAAAAARQARQSRDNAAAANEPVLMRRQVQLPAQRAPQQATSESSSSSSSSSRLQTGPLRSTSISSSSSSLWQSSAVLNEAAVQMEPLVRRRV